MKALDRHYLALQFRLLIHTKHGIEFQSFFEGIMRKTYKDFQRIRPYGDIGDAGNDGFIRDSGAYYQVYGTANPPQNEAAAAKKVQEDFDKLNRNWDGISKIRQFNFVFNDKYGGSSLPIERAIASLKAKYASIDFRPLLAQDLENLFLDLPEEAILDLGFNLDQREATKNAHQYLEGVRKALDLEDAKYAHRQLEQAKSIVESLDDSSLLLEYGLIDCRCQQKLENIAAASAHFRDLARRFPKDSRALLHLAEIALNEGDLQQNGELLTQAASIDSSSSFLELQSVLRRMFMGERVDTQHLDDNTFPVQPRERANFYRLHAVRLALAGEYALADSYIANALHFNPERLISHLDELTILEIRILSSHDAPERAQLADQLLRKAEDLDKRFTASWDIGPRNLAMLLAKRISAHLVRGEDWQVIRTSQQALTLLMQCHFDKRIDHQIAMIIRWIMLPATALIQLMAYLRKSGKSISDELGKELIPQFSSNGMLVPEGKQFLSACGLEDLAALVDDLEKADYNEVLRRLEHDAPLAVALANTLRGHPELRKRIIEGLPDDKEIQKDKLKMLVNFEEEEVDAAFDILRSLDLSNLDYLECRPMLEIAHAKRAWDIELIIIAKLLESETREPERFKLELRRFEAYRELGMFSEALRLGGTLLDSDLEMHFLSADNREALLAMTLSAAVERAKVDSAVVVQAKQVLEKHRAPERTLEFRQGTEAEIYLLNGEAANALTCITEGVQRKKVLSPQEYASLYFVLGIKIANALGLTIESQNAVVDGTLVKLRSSEQWYSMGEANELDAVKIPAAADRYALFLGKKPGDTVLFPGSYGVPSREDIVEAVLGTEQYVLWQTVHHFHRLAEAGDLEGVRVIAVPQTDTGIDLHNLVSFLQDEQAKQGSLFEMYCKGGVPLAMLAVSEGGLTHAIGRIQGEGNGFVNCAVGTDQELAIQKAMARRIVEDDAPFYLDGTSALFLSETGLLPKALPHLPGLRVPQTVLNFLANTAARFRSALGEKGYIGLAAGQIRVSQIESGAAERIAGQFAASVKALEAKPTSIIAISAASKADCFSETTVAPELSDACVLAQRDGLPIVTEDYLYLKFNEAETGKKQPEYCSSLALARALYEKKILTFDEYLDYFAYLSSYRCRLLSLDSTDLEKAMLGGGSLKVVMPGRIRKLQLPLTLSEDYGVSFERACVVVANFLWKLLADGAITQDVARSVFIELLDAFPTDKNKREVGHVLLGLSMQILEKHAPRALSHVQNRAIADKIAELARAADIFGSKGQLWKPE